jgi:tRNA modification GTPase
VFSPDDTIVAIATPPGAGGIGIVRISGSEASRVAAALINRKTPLQPRVATFTKLADPGGERRSFPRDEVVVTLFPAPRSYTGQDVVEISAHGSPVVLEGIVRAALDAGARLAEPGEFTLRAFLTGKRDLVQAEAVADLIAAATPLQARVAFDQLEGTLTHRIGEIDAVLFDLVARLEASIDFPDEGYHFVAAAAIAAEVGTIIAIVDDLLRDASSGRLIRDGATVAIAGRPNVGKSSLFNALAGTERAIVTAIPGTTRDLITERVAINGIVVTLVDTAGAREAEDVIEREGVSRGVRASEVADAVVVVVDASEPATEEDRRVIARTAERRRVLVGNKSDRDSGTWPEAFIRVSALTGDGVDALRGAIVQALGAGEVLRDRAAISNTRHIALLEEARSHLSQAHSAAMQGSPEEFVVADLQEARARFDAIVGKRTSDDVLAHIFERFCIGK